MRRRGHTVRCAWDLSAEARHSLSAASRAVVERLPEPLRFTVIAPDYGGLRAPAQLLMERYRRARPDIAQLYAWRYQNLGNLPAVESHPAYRTANAGACGG